MQQLPDYITQIREYFRAGTHMAFSKGEKLVTEDKRIQPIYYLSSGYIRIYSVNSRGEQYTHVIYGPGDIFPVALLTKKQSTFATYETMTEVELYCQPHDQLTKDLIDTKGLAYGMMQQVIQQYYNYTMRVDNLEYKYASERLAYRLILLANRFGEHSGNSITIIPPMTHVVLGSSLNLSRESVSREMEKLVKKGLIRYNGARQIVINDIAKLSTQTKVPLHQGLS